LVWAALCCNGLGLGLYFFEQNVNGIAYLRMLNEFVFPQLAEDFNNQYWEGRYRGLWLAQDGDPAHRHIEVRGRLNDVFGKHHIIGLCHDVEWPPRSPDLTPCEFFCGDILKIKYFELHLKILTSYSRGSSESSMPYESSLPSFDGQ
jgi:hypothetical protein